MCLFEGSVGRTKDMVRAKNNHINKKCKGIICVSLRDNM